MTAVVVAVLGLLSVAALIVVPLLLPWRRHLSWLVATSGLPDLWAGATPSDLVMDEVQVISPPRGEVVWIITCRGGEPSALPLARLKAVVRARLEDWANAGTPLLRLVFPDGSTSLHHASRCVLFAEPRQASRSTASTP